MGINGESPNYVLRQDYKYFYHDGNLSSYALLLMGTRIGFNSTITNIGMIEFEMKLLSYSNQLIVELDEPGKNIQIYVFPLLGEGALWKELGY